MVKKNASENWLVFVDTNILLDFYRLRGGSAVRQLEALERHKERLILSEQVQMEYLKHRQRVVGETLKELKSIPNQSLPPILSEYQPAQMMKKHAANANKKFNEVKTKAEKIISEPANHDEVYKRLQRIFRTCSDLNLGRDNGARLRVRSLARKRFSLGYPPRKNSDTSIGDAYNWEWIISCAQSAKDNSHILIVSRDGDFGVTREKKSFLNDWLKKEFRERVSRKRKVELTERLTDALKRLDEAVSLEDEQNEEELLRSTDWERSARAAARVSEQIRRTIRQSGIGDFEMSYDFQRQMEKLEFDKLIERIQDQFHQGYRQNTDGENEE
ncbi:PIN domain-containing protein [Aliiroseovarius crassostreae]|uniref:PIN domain-containing protein n=1 Tax=Aliiroseovarius crassostreae TaxID=154981 RepID=UPI002205BA89|nr:PIN domain-containing protein [Aliiroseovarius crassostreae]UWQ11952.1 PIN domain-containing protein [Aliiroseovarius crassostreae]